MARLLHLTAWFLTGAITITVLGWIASIDPSLKLLVSGLLAFLLAGYGLAWLLDDWIQTYLKLDELTYKGALIGILAAGLTGAIVVFMTGRNAL